MHIYYLEGVTNQYIDADRIHHKNNGQGKKDTINLISALEIDTANAKQILDQFYHKRERLEIF